MTDYASLLIGGGVALLLLGEFAYAVFFGRRKV